MHQYLCLSTLENAEQSSTLSLNMPKVIARQIVHYMRQLMIKIESNTTTLSREDTMLSVQTTLQRRVVSESDGNGFNSLPRNDSTFVNMRQMVKTFVGCKCQKMAEATKLPTDQGLSVVGRN